jgi:hypothetical protein
LNNLINKIFSACCGKRYSISEWYGRTGNNIQQVANCIMLAEKRGHCFEQNLKHEIIKRFEYNFGKDGYTQKGKYFSWEAQIDCKTNTIYGKNEINISKEYLYKNMRRICSNYILPYLNIPTHEPFDDDTLVIHIRGGDIFETEFTIASNYVQNPLAFYLKLIEKYPKILIVVEPNSNNPVVFELKKNSRLRFQSLSLKEDFATLLAAKNLVTSGVGTFAIAAALCSKNIKNLFCSNIYLTEHLNYRMFENTDVNIHETILKDFIPVYPCSWTNNASQRKFLIDYQLPDKSFS